MAKATEEPQGIAFYSIKTDETHYCKLEPTIAAYINSSDLGINASRGQDFGWRLAPEWVKRVKDFKKDSIRMQMLTANNQGRKPTTVNILYHLYNEDMRAYQEELEENENPFEEKYQQQISGSAPKKAKADLVDEEISEYVDDDDLLPAGEPTKAPKTSTKSPKK